MRIYLMRHAEALNPEVDAKRPLSEVGRQNTVRIAQFLKSISVDVNTIYHSGVLRAEQTAQIIADSITANPHLQILKNLNSPDAASVLAEEINYWNKNVFLVGHIPLLPRLLAKLVVNNENLWPIYFQQPATVVCLENSSNSGWGINWVIDPGILPE